MSTSLLWFTAAAENKQTATTLFVFAIERNMTHTGSVTAGMSCSWLFFQSQPYTNIWHYIAPLTWIRPNEVQTDWRRSAGGHFFVLGLFCEWTELSDFSLWSSRLLSDWRDSKSALSILHIINMNIPARGLTQILINDTDFFLIISPVDNEILGAYDFNSSNFTVTTREQSRNRVSHSGGWSYTKCQ